MIKKIPSSKSQIEPTKRKIELREKNINSKSLNQNDNKFNLNKNTLNLDSNYGSNEVEENIYKIINKSNFIDKISVNNQDSPKIQYNLRYQPNKRNYILENRIIINKIAKPFEIKQKEKLHRNFGRTPN